ncbi:elongation factor G [Clostridium tertium]|jgi:elongation factor G|uniref:Elongation factor G n=1 Tax=Clostridium tertium TaxID=1559 RepID=A0A9X3XNX8_9CLOT|nr:MULTISPECIES: elongation factor G [Clostridium]MBU6137365.1 elongation factor G [Clostridium tertium]MDB1924471.1 elongation factor G [Clostridium tertium]MDB1927975.1 elongation factor G [Clostridium tertium]MDB1931581.1 elongation factor G [Clostridium tertium]MDB1942079.1 elongation factor G [Clostridium tertium]
MKNYTIKNLRNIGLIGHGASGKTSLVEALLFNTGNTDRLGRVEDGTTVTDFDQEEKKRGISLSVSIAPIEADETKINLVDIPGYFDFSGELIQGMRAVDVATIVVCGVSGVQVGTEKAWDYCNKIKLPRTFFINKLDRENSSYDKTLAQLKEKFGISVVPIQYPIGTEDDFKGVVNVISKRVRIHDPKTNKIQEMDAPEELLEKIDECKRMIMEAVAETSEELLDKYFSEGELSDEEIYSGLIEGCASGEIAPVMCGSASKVIGMRCFLEDVVECFPSPKYSIPQKAINTQNSEEVFIGLDENKPFSALVFKTIADPFVGKISLFRVITGKLSNEVTVINSNKDKTEKLANVFFMRGKNQIPTKEVVAGDIAAVAKLQYTETGDTLCDINNKVIYDKMNFPKPAISMAVLPKAKGDEDKISAALQRLLEEDPTFTITRDTENAETIISGVGETHLDVIASRLRNKFGAEVILRLPKIPYRETIKGIADVQGKHKKQSGGHGQYGDVKIKFEPRKDGESDLEFVDNVVGGVVPRNFIPAVEKGLRECIEKGVLAGYPVVGLRATLHDGSYHPVDSSEMAFKMATSIAYKKGLEQAKAILLEPIMHVEIFIPDEYMGDVIGDINKRRGRVLGMEPDGNLQKIIAEVPLAEMFKYSTDLRSMTQARGSFTSEIERYEEVPELEVKKIIEESRKN